MKKLYRFYLILASAVFTLSLQSCKEEVIAPGDPIVTGPSAVTAVEVGAKAEITFSFITPGKFKSASVTATGGTAVIKASPVTGSLEGSVIVEFTAGSAVGAGSVIIELLDAGGQQVTSTAVVNITIAAPVTLQGTLTTQSLDASKDYLLKGIVFIPSGVTLTIPAGTVIKGEKASKATLVVQPGGKLIANGTASKPIVFTSAQAVGERDRGDWGGLVILGNAFVNQSAKPAIEGITPSQTYGSIAADGATPATNQNEDSGSLTYVRVEYAGIELTPNNETNSLTFGAIGSGTTVDYVQVSFGGDDGFEWFGGTVNAKHLISFSTWDDDFDTDFGWGGNVQYGLVVRNTFFADQSGSNAFESDNQGNGNSIAGICDNTTQVGCTRGVFSNITVLGPRDVQSRSISANYQNAIHIRRRTAISIFNSFFSGFRVGVRLDDQGTLDNLTSGASKHAYNLMTVPGTTLAGSTTTAADAAFATGLTISGGAGAGDASAISNYWNTNNNLAVINISSSNNATLFTDAGIGTGLFWAAQTASNYPSNPNFALVAGVAGTNNLNTGANYTDAKLGSFFEKTGTFRGAFGSTDWTDGWAEFQPVNKPY